MSETQTQAPTKATVADAPAAAVAAAKDVATDVAKAAAKPVRKARAVIAKRRARKAPAKLAKTVKRVAAAATAPIQTKNEGITAMTYDFTKFFAGFELPGTDKAQALFADANGRGQAFAAKGQRAVEDMGELTRANVEAMVEAGRIAAAGAKAIGQDVVAASREGFEQASEGFKTLAEAKSITEYFQLQGEIARTQFDRFVAESSKLTERMVKLAGESAQPLQARASLNAEKAGEIFA